MKQFSIYENPQGDFQAVKIGFCWPGFFFGVIWALFCKMWKLGLCLIGISIVISLVGGAATNPESIAMAETFSRIFGLFVSLALGAKGNELREKDLMSKGYEFKGTELFNNKEDAIAQYIKFEI